MVKATTNQTWDVAKVADKYAMAIKSKAAGHETPIATLAEIVNESMKPCS
jgi:hypothetical protein